MPSGVIPGVVSVGTVNSAGFMLNGNFQRAIWEWNLGAAEIPTPGPGLIDLSPESSF